MKTTLIAILAVMSLATEARAQQPSSVEALDGVVEMRNAGLMANQPAT